MTETRIRIRTLKLGQPGFSEAAFRTAVEQAMIGQPAPDRDTAEAAVRAAAGQASRSRP